MYTKTFQILMSDIEGNWIEMATEKQLERERKRIEREKVQSYKKRKRYENLEHARDEVATIGTMAEFKHHVKHRIPFYMYENAGRITLRGEWDRMNKRYTVLLRKVPFLIWDHQWYVAESCYDDFEFLNALAPDAMVLATYDMYRLQENGMAGVAVGVEVEDKWGRPVSEGYEFKDHSLEQQVNQLIQNNNLTRQYFPKVKGKRR